MKPVGRIILALAIISGMWWSVHRVDGDLVQIFPGEGVVSIINVGVETPRSSRRHNDRMIVRLPATTPLGFTPKDQLDQFFLAFETNHPDMHLEVVDSILNRNMYLIRLRAPRSSDFDLLEIELETAYTTQVQWVEMLYENDSPEGGTGSVHVDNLVEQADFRNQYLVNNLNLSQANTLSKGQFTTVAILDTGIDAAHPLFSGCILPNGYDFVDDDPVPADVGDGNDTDGDGAIDEMVGHGTFVAGLVSLVAPGAHILPVRVLNGDGIGDNWTLAKGIFYALEQGVDVINLSLRSTYRSDAVEDALQEVENSGIFTAAAAGNENRFSPVEFPAMTNKAFGVAALDIQNIKTDFSNYHEELFISAPGGNLLVNGAPVPAGSIISALPGGTYAIWDGTSMATPLVSGAAALIRAQYPDDADWPNPVIFPEDIVDNIATILANTAENIDGLNPLFVNMLGAGVLNIGAAVNLGPPAPALCVAGDVNTDGIVDFLDLMIVINNYGACPQTPTICLGDLNRNDRVDITDLIEVINYYGTCP